MEAHPKGFYYPSAYAYMYVCMCHVSRACINACYSRSNVSTTARNLQKETFVLPVGLCLCESLHAQVTSQEDNAPESDFV